MQEIDPTIHSTDVPVIHETHVEHNGNGHDHHHKQSFITKYIFSQDHKTIAKQFLITGMTWAIVGGLFSVLFRLQLAYPDESFSILETFFGRWAQGGQIQPEFYYALITMHGTVLVFFVLTGGLSGTFANLLIPLQIGARDMASPFFEHAFLLVFLYGQRSNVLFIICTNRPCQRWMDCLPAIECIRTGFGRF